MRIARAVPAAIVVVVALVGVALVPAGAQQKVKADDVGITDTEIRVAVIADVDNPIVPGLFKAGADAVKAWGAVINKAGGLAGRKVVVDFIDSKLSANDTRNAVIKACSEDFALVGTEALSLNNVSDLETCPNAQGEPIGIPELPGLVSAGEKCSPVVYYVTADGKYCDTKDAPTVTYTTQRGDYRYYVSKNKDLHGIWLAPADVKSVKDAAVPSYQAGMDLGVEEDGDGIYDVFARDPQSSLTPFMNIVKDNGSTFVYNGSSASKMVQARQEAAIQGVDSVKVWACHQGCYDEAFLESGGADVDGTHSLINTLPFYSEYKANASLKSFAKQVGGVDKLNSYGVSAWVAALLFQDAVEKAVADGGTLTRQSLFDALETEHDFDAQGIMGPVDVAGRIPPKCIVVAQVKDGKWARVHPTKPNTFDCSKQNLTEITASQSG
jgi:ABC-type branched-subunit amino acid transport system substrate-binding protein